MKSKPQKNIQPFTAVIKKLKGVLGDQKIDKKEYRKYLEIKYFENN